MILIKCFVTEISARPEVALRTRSKFQRSNFADESMKD